MVSSQPEAEDGRTGPLFIHCPSTVPRNVPPPSTNCPPKQRRTKSQTSAPCNPLLGKCRGSLEYLCHSPLVRSGHVKLQSGSNQVKQRPQKRQKEGQRRPLAPKAPLVPLASLASTARPVVMPCIGLPRYLSRLHVTLTITGQSYIVIPARNRTAKRGTNARQSANKEINRVTDSLRPFLNADMITGHSLIHSLLFTNHLSFVIPSTATSILDTLTL